MFSTLFLSACNADEDGRGGKANAKCQVVMSAYQGVDTRTMDSQMVFVEDDVLDVGGSVDTRTQVGEVADGEQGSLQPVRWSDDDKFLAWAAPVGVDGSASTNYADGFEAATFSLDHYNYTFTSADFVATIPSAMSQTNTYDYYAVYPLPAGHTGTTVTYNLPTVQSGDYDGAQDVMRATVRGQALVERDPGQLSTAVRPEPSLSFEHLMHVMRIYVPTARNLMWKGIKRLEITFPQNVVGGTLSFDAARPNVEPVWSGQTNKVMVEMDDDNLLSAGGRYVWVFIKPGEMSGEIKFRGYKLSGEPSQLISTTVSAHNFKSQHITPITLTIPEELKPVTVSFSCPDNDSFPNFLGEAANAMYVDSWPMGIVALNEEDNVITSTTGTFVAKFFYEAGELNTDLPGNTMTVGFTSAHADVRQNKVSFTMPTTMAPGMSYILNFALPYLFYEDFANATAVSSNDNNGDDTDGIHDIYSGISLDAYNLAGWTGASIGVQASTAARVCGRYDDVLWLARYRRAGRLDSKPLNIIAASTVAVTFNYSAGHNKSDNDVVPNAVCGYTTTSGVINGVNNNSNTNVWTISGATGISIPNYSGSYTSIGNVTSYSISECTNAHRLSWEVSTTGSAGNSNANTWLYIDNVKVSVGSTTKHTDKNYRTFFPSHQN